jgi:hypothetical protein
MTASRLRIGLRVLALVALLFGTLTARVVYSARSELTAARRAADGGELDSAIAHYRRAARYYAPGSPYHVAALDQLAALGRAAERAHSPRIARSAARSSLLAASTFRSASGSPQPIDGLRR